MCDFAILYKDGRFHMETVSFCIPDGYYLDADYEEPLGNIAIDLISPDKMHRVGLYLTSEELRPNELLIDIIKDIGGEMLHQPEAITVGGLHGYYAIYESSGKLYVEAIFNLDDWEEYNAFSIVFIFPQDYDTSNFVQSRDFLRIAQNIRKEK